MRNSVWGETTQFFYSLTPEVIDTACKRLGLDTSGRVIELNSLENRVYQIGLDTPHPWKESYEGPFTENSIIIKFYRPGRWSMEALKEEHAFLNELYSYELPIVCPFEFEGETIFQEPQSELLYSVYPKVLGRLKDEYTKEELSAAGKILASLHNIGALAPFKHRPHFSPANYLDVHLEYLKSCDFLPQTPLQNFLTLGHQISQFLTPHFQHLSSQRIHGDFHRGNLIWTDEGPWIVDFDDCSSGPKQQDLWLLTPGRDSEAQKDQETFLESYHLLAKEEVPLTLFHKEAFRSIRMIHFSGWIARRWEDPSFKRAFMDFDQQIYWENQLLDLKEQLGILQESLSY